MLFLRTLGSVSLSGDRGEEFTAVLSQPKRCALLIYLAVARRGGLVRRDSLLLLFWPEQDQVHARNALCQSLYFLRRNLPQGTIVSRGREEVGVAVEAIGVDVSDFEACVAEEWWSDAIDIYGGSFLEGFYVGDAPGFEEWMSGERERLREAAAGAAWSLAGEQIQAGALVEAERTAQRAVDLVCTDESPVRGFIEALAAAGERAAALNFFGRYSARLRLELDLDPSCETQKVVEEIRNGNARAPSLHAQVRRERGGGFEGAGTRLMAPGGSGSDSGPTADPVPATMGPRCGTAVRADRVKSRRRATRIVAVLSTIALGAAVWSRWAGDRGSRVSPPWEYTILAEVEGSAPEDLRAVVGRLMADALANHTVLVALPPGQLDAALQEAMKSDTTRITVPVASELAFRAGIATVVSVELDAVGAAYRLAARVALTEGDSVIARASAQAADEDDLLRVADALGRSLAESLGEERWSTEGQWWRQRRPPMATSSFAAYRKLLDAASANSQRRYRDAVDLAHDALALDTGFAAAWAHLTWYYWNLRVPDSAAYALEHAEMRSGRLDERMMLVARATGSLARGDLAEHLRLRERIFREYGGGHNNYAVALAAVGRHEEAVGVIQEWCATLPYRPPDTVMDNLIYWLVTLRRFDEAKSWVEVLSGDLRPVWQFGIALAAADWAEAERHVTPLLDFHPPGPRTASLLAARGRVREALTILRAQLRDASEGRPDRAVSMVESALILAVASGDTLPWDRRILAANRSERARRVEAIWAAVNGDEAGASLGVPALPDDALVIAGRLDHDVAQLTLARAWRAFVVGDWDKVVTLLEPVTGEGAPLGSASGSLMNPLSHWTLAEAYERLDRVDSAAVHWSRLAAAEGLSGEEVIRRGYSHSFAHRRAALAYGRLGRSELAKEHWRVFLADFSDPDPELGWMVEEGRQALSALEG